MLPWSETCRFCSSKNTDIAAAYDVQFAGDSHRSGNFRPQGDPEESRLESLSPEQIVRSRSKPWRMWCRGNRAAAIREELQKDRVGTELWLPLAILALLLATTETWLAHWFSRSR